MLPLCCANCFHIVLKYPSVPLRIEVCKIPYARDYPELLVLVPSEKCYTKRVREKYSCSSCSRRERIAMYVNLSVPNNVERERYSGGYREVLQWRLLALTELGTFLEYDAGMYRSVAFTSLLDSIAREGQRLWGQAVIYNVQWSLRFRLGITSACSSSSLTSSSGEGYGYCQHVSLSILATTRDVPEKDGEGRHAFVLCSGEPCSTDARA